MLDSVGGVDKGRDGMIVDEQIAITQLFKFGRSDKPGPLSASKFLLRLLMLHRCNVIHMRVAYTSESRTPSQNASTTRIYLL